MINGAMIKTGICIAALSLSACSFGGSADTADTFMQSGTIILSHQVPQRSSQEPLELAQNTYTARDRAQPSLMAPLIGYFPPATGYVPADNEAWLEIDTSKSSLTVFRGREVLAQLQAEGQVDIAPGEYFLRHKQKEPKWYAPDSYFHNRRLAAPAKDDSMRFRRGALGDFAIYPTPEFPIHCGPVWADEVGGLRVDTEELSTIFYMLPVGAPVVVR